MQLLKTKSVAFQVVAFKSTPQTAQWSAGYIISLHHNWYFAIQLIIDQPDISTSVFVFPYLPYLQRQTI